MVYCQSCFEEISQPAQIEGCCEHHCLCQRCGTEIHMDSGREHDPNRCEECIKGETVESTRVINGCCIREMRDLGRFDFGFADPPFNIGQDYTGYDDNKLPSDFEQ